MPIYEYRCQQGHTFEVVQRMSDDPPVSCQTCESPVERVFHPVAVHFKGSGFYTTDYGSRKRSRDGEEKSEEKSDDKHSSDSKKPDSASKSSESPKSASSSGGSD